MRKLFIARRKKRNKRRFKKKGKQEPIRGFYKNFQYASGLELAFILHYESLGHKIRNFDMEPISYSLRGKRRSYYPDFVINDEIIVEIKGHHFGKQDEIFKKRQALSEWCKDKKFSHAFIQRGQIPNGYVKKAIRLHYQLKERR